MRGDGGSEHADAAFDLRAIRCLRQCLEKLLEGMERDVVLSRTIGRLTDVEEQLGPLAERIGALEVRERVFVVPVRERGGAGIEETVSLTVGALRTSHVDECHERESDDDEHCPELHHSALMSVSALYGVKP